MVMMNRQMIEGAQASWGRGIVAIGKEASQESAKVVAGNFIRAHYLLDGDTLLFCPTKASVCQFRCNFEDALSYFVGGDDRHAEDTGFALQPWSGVRFENAGLVFKGDVAMAMGNYFFAQDDGSELKVEYSFVYTCNEAKQVRIQLHHSALVYGTNSG
jgi:hypothetical protein